MAAWMALLLAALAPQEVISRLFAATSDGPFVSYSWGEHWSPLRADLRGFEGRLDAFACLGPLVFAGGTDGLFVSGDYGENFRPVERWPAGTGGVTRILSARLFALEPTLFVGTEHGLYRSTDGGVKWSRVGESEVRSAVRDLSWPGPELFAATDGGLHRSRDMGMRWERIGTGLPEARLLSLGVAQFFGLEPTLFAGSDGSGLYKSTDGGERFEAVGGRWLGGASVRSLVWWESLLVVGTDQGLYFSEDGGASFREAGDLRGLSVASISIPGAEANVPSDVIVGTNRGVYKSSDGGLSFRRVQEGMGEVEVRALATFPMPPQNRERRPR